MYNFEIISDIEKMYEDYFPRIYNYVFYRLLHREQTEDVVSEVFLKVIASIRKFDPEKASFTTWIFCITNNAIIDHYRKQRRYVQTPDGTLKMDAITEVDFDEQCEKILSDDRKQLYNALSGLDEKQRHIIALKYFGDFNNRTISQMTGINESSVSTICFRAIAKLRALLKDVATGLQDF